MAAPAIQAPAPAIPEAFTKHVKIGTVMTPRGGYLPVWVIVQYGLDKLNPGTPGPVLSITGCIGRSQWGQIDMSFRGKHRERIVNYAPDMNAALWGKLRYVWSRWHLNGMCAGTPAQMDAVRQWRASDGNPYNYDAVQVYLKDRDLLIDAHDYQDGTGTWPYKYGSAWLYQSVPAEVVAFLYSLPNAEVIPTWL